MATVTVADPTEAVREEAGMARRDTAGMADAAEGA